MFKLFTVETANDLLDAVDERLTALETAVRELRDAHARARDARRDAAEALALRQEIGFLAGAAHDARRDLERLGVQVPDLEAGVVEFPARVGGEIVHLVWERGEHAVTRYHRLTGDATTYPLDVGDVTPTPRDENAPQGASDPRA
ncbi:MAG: DUF2203 family protein [Trueperaceae bacterium]|nr:DUF2203 family protein [Trueperaceae bacterium]